MARAWCRLADGTCRWSTRASSTSTWRCARRRACSTSATWARSSWRGRTRSRRVQKISVERRGKIERRPGAVFGADDAGRHVRRRPARVSPRHRALPARGQCRQHRQGVQMDRRARAPGWRRRGRQFELAVCAARGAGARKQSGIVQQLTSVDLASHQVLLVCARRSGQRAQHHLPHRLHGRGRLRAVHSAGIRRARVECDPRRGRRSGDRARRPWRARHAAPRGGNASVRSGYRRDDDRPRGRSRLDCRLEKERLHRQGCARRSRSAPGQRASSSGSK